MSGKPVSVAHSGPESTSGKWPRKVTTTMEPDREIEVGEAEYHDLRAWGLIKNEGK